jgi:hypothetical protein
MKTWKNFLSWVIAIILLTGCILLSKCISVTIFNTRVTVLDSNTPFFARPSHINADYGPAYGPETSTERAFRNGFFNGTMLSELSIHTSHGDVNIPFGSGIQIKQSLYGMTTGYIAFNNKSGFINTLEFANTMFGNNIVYIKLTPSGSLMQFELNKAVPITLDNINFNVLSMGKGKLELQTGTEYIFLFCNNFLPIVLNENEKIYLSDTIKPFSYEDIDNEFSQRYYEIETERVNAGFKSFNVRIINGTYGFYTYQFSYGSGTRFVIEHPSLSDKLDVCEVEFDVCFNDIISYRVNYEEEKIFLPLDKRVKELDKAIERAEIFRNYYNKSLEFNTNY